MVNELTRHNSFETYPPKIAAIWTKCLLLSDEGELLVHLLPTMYRNWFFWKWMLSTEVVEVDQSLISSTYLLKLDLQYEIPVCHLSLPNTTIHIVSFMVKLSLPSCHRILTVLSFEIVFLLFLLQTPLFCQNLHPCFDLHKNSNKA